MQTKTPLSRLGKIFRALAALPVCAALLFGAVSCALFLPAGTGTLPTGSSRKESSDMSSEPSIPSGDVSRQTSPASASSETAESVVPSGTPEDPTPSPSGTTEDPSVAPDPPLLYAAGVYLGVSGYGKQETTAQNKDSFTYRFFLAGKEEVLSLRGDETSRYSLQNLLQEGSLYRLTLRDGAVIRAEEATGASAGIVRVENGQRKLALSDGQIDLPRDLPCYAIERLPGGARVRETLPEDGQSACLLQNGDDARLFLDPPKTAYTPPVSGTPGVRTLKNLLQTALMPVGRTLYVYGGGWNWEDTASSVQSASIGLPDSWTDFFALQDSSYSYKDPRGEEALRDPEHSYYPFGGYNEYFYAGADCSGYLGWVLYNTVNRENGAEGFVCPSTVFAARLAGKGLGSVRFTAYPAEGALLRPGDIVSIKGHVYLCLGSCEDGSVLIVHSTPGKSREGCPGSGVQISAIGPSRGCMAYKLAKACMETHYPEWSQRYETLLCDPGVYLPANAAVFSFTTDPAAEEFSDPDGFSRLSPAQILEALFAE